MSRVIGIELKHFEAFLFGNKYMTFKNICIFFPAVFLIFFLKKQPFIFDLFSIFKRLKLI